MTLSARPDDIATDLVQRAVASGLAPLQLRGRMLLPVVQGGMGVGVSAHRLAGSVAALGAVGTISSVDLRRHHPDLMEHTHELLPGEAATRCAKLAINAANLEALDREIRAARTLSGGRGLLAVNVMRAVAEYAPSVKRALECGIDAVVVGAGLPLDLPELAQDHPEALLVPILSDARGVQLLVRKWERKNRLPDAIVIEHPRLAGGHLGAAKIADLCDPRFDFENVIPQSLAFLRSAGIDKHIPLIAAGGIRSHADIARLQALSVPAGTQLFEEHAPCQGFPLVLDGEVRVARGTAQGRSLELYRVGPGELCVVSACGLFGNAPLAAHAVAVAPTRLLLLSPAGFEQWVAHEPFRRFVFGVFADRLADLMSLAAAVAFQRLDQRLAAALLGHGPTVMTTHQALADELGTVREIVTRLLKRFERAGWVSLARERIELRDVAALRALSAGELRPG